MFFLSLSLSPEQGYILYRTGQDPDTSNGYWRIKVDDESSKLLTFATPFGRYRFKRFTFGIHSASQVFQLNISDITEACEGARNSQDDNCQRQI